MDDEVAPPSPAPAAAVDVSVPAAPIPAPQAGVPEPQASPSVPAVPATPAPVVDAAPAVAEPAKVTPHTDTPTLLEEAKPVEGKPGEAKPDDAPKPTEAAPVALAPYVLPEGVKLDNARIGTFNELLTKELPPQERGQALVDMHIKEMQAYAAHTAQEQQRIFSDTRAGWRKQAMSDGEMGGAGWETSMISVAKMRDMFVRESDRGEFNNFLRVTGAGDHPQFLKFLFNVARRFDEPAPSHAPYQPPPDIGKRPQGGRRSSLYDHPTSSTNRNR